MGASLNHATERDAVRDSAGHPGVGAASAKAAPAPAGSGLWLFLTILAVVFGAEAAVMFTLGALPRLGGAWEAALDASILTLLIAPFIWWRVVHPLRARAIADSQRAEARIQRLNHVYAVLSEVNQAIVRIRDTRRLFREACRILVETGGFQMAWIGLRASSSDEVAPVAHVRATIGGIEEPQVEAPGEVAAPPFSERSRQVCNDLESDQAHSRWREQALAQGYRAWATFPLTVGGEFFGTLALCSDVAGCFNHEELRLLDEMAADLSFALEMSQLEELRIRLATTIEQSPVSVVITAADGRIEYVNPAFTTMTGYTSEEALGSNPRLLKSGRQTPEFYEKLWATIKGGKSWHGEMVNRRKDNRLYSQEMTIAPVHEAAGVTRFVAISQDVTERKRVSERLRLQGAALEAAANAVMITDRMGRIVWVNEAFTRLTGWLQEECVGRTPAILRSGSEDRTFYAELWRTILRGDVWQREMVNRRKDGELYVEDQTITPVKNDRGEITHFVAIKLDIRERKLAEEALEGSRGLYRSLFDQSPDGVLLIDARTGGTIDANPAASRQLGYLPEEFARLSISDYEALETPEETSQRTQKLLADGSGDFETLHRTKSGETRNVHVWARLLQLEGRPAFHCIFEDITDRKRAEQVLITSLQEKEALLKEVHHRVKNNLQVITSLLRLEASRIDHPETRSVLKDVQNRIQSMAVLHETLYRSGRFADVDLGVYLRLLAGQLMRSVGSTPDQVDLRLDLASVRLNLEQAIPCGLIVNELVSNSLKHAFPAGQSGVIWVELHQAEEGALRLRVRDNGAGVPADFEIRRARSLGLQLAGDLARQLGGSLKTISGHGSSFEVTFPPRRAARQQGALSQS